MLGPTPFLEAVCVIGGVLVLVLELLPFVVIGELVLEVGGTVLVVWIGTLEVMEVGGLELVAAELLAEFSVSCPMALQGVDVIPSACSDEYALLSAVEIYFKHESTTLSYELGFHVTPE